MKRIKKKQKEAQKFRDFDNTKSDTGKKILKHDLTTGDIKKTVLMTALPLILSFLANALYNLVDALYLGRLSEDSLAAVGFVFPPYLFSFAFIIGIAGGMSSLISRLIGAKKFEKVKNTYANGIIFSMIVSAFFIVLLFLLQDKIYAMMGANEIMIDLIHDYSFLFFLTLIFSAATIATNFAFRAEGNTKYVMLVIMSGTILNVILDPIFIFTLKMGVFGASLATFISIILSFLIAMYRVFHLDTLIKFPKKIQFDITAIKEILKVGSAATTANILTSITAFVLTGIASGFGVYYTAAYTAGLRLETFFITPIFAFMNSMIIIVGQCFGAGKIERAKKVIRETIIMLAVIYFFVSVLSILLSGAISSLFTKDAHLQEIIKNYIIIFSPSYILFAISAVIIGAMIGIGRPKISLISNFLRYVVFIIPLSFLFTKHFGFLGIPIAVCVSYCLASIVTIILFMKIDLDKIKKEHKQENFA